MRTLPPVAMPSTRSACPSAPSEIEALVEEHCAYLHRLTLSILDDPAEAEDAAQETFIAASRGLANFAGHASLKTWLTAIAVNQCRGRLRKRKIWSTLQTTLEALHLLAPAPPSPEEAVLRTEADEQLWQAVDALNEKHRLPVVLRYVHELGVPEIARILGVPEGTVHSRLHHAREQLLARLGPHASPSEPADDA